MPDLAPPTPPSTPTAAFADDPPESPAVGPALVDAIEGIECRAIVDLFEAAPESTRRRLGLQIERRGGMTAVRSASIDSLFFNRLFVSGESSREDLFALIRGYEHSGIGRYLVHVAPTCGPRVEGWLEERNVTPFRRHWVKFLRDTSPVAREHTDLRVRPVEARDAEAYAAILTRAFQIPDAAISLWAGVVGRPGWHLYVACDGDTPVASGCLFVHGDMGNLAGAATLPSHQRRGAQGALLEARLTAASAAGCAYVTSETGVRIEGEPNGSYRNMLKVGLRPVYLRRNFAPRGTLWAPA